MKFATSLCCMDGRVQVPVINWIKENYRVDFVDMITEAGMDCLLADKKCVCRESLINKIDISIDKHGSGIIFIVGHSDCGGNPVDDDTHKKHIKEAVENIRRWKPSVKTAGLWVSCKWAVEKIVEE